MENNQLAKNNLSQFIEFYRIEISSRPITLYLKRSFNTAHSSSATRTNFIIRTSISKPSNSSQNNGNKPQLVEGYGQCGLPPKKPYCYLSDINDCQSFIKIAQQEFQAFQKHLLTQTLQSQDISQLMQKNYNDSLGQYIDCEGDNNYVENLAFFKNKYKSIMEGNKHNQGHFTSQFFFYLQVFFLIKIGKQLSHKNSQFKAPRNALQFSLLDLIGQIENKSVSELLYENKCELKIAQNFSFYTISHEQDLKSMLENGRDSLKFTDCIKIKFNNEVQKLIQLLKVMDSQNVGRKWIIDANSSWSPQDFIKFLTLFNKLIIINPTILQKVLFVQQPFPIFKSLHGIKSQQQIENEQKQWQQIKSNDRFVIIADQSFASSDDLEQVKKYSHGINIKMEKCGGPFEALKILKLMDDRKFSFLMFGSMVSTHLGCTQTYQFYEYAQYFDIDGALLVKQPQINGGFEWKGQEGIKKVMGKGLAINQQDIRKLF